MRQYQDIFYELIRSKRKTASILVDKQGNVVVRAPLRMPQKSIEQFLEQYRNWLKEKIRQRNAEYLCRQSFCKQEGDTLTVLGQEYPVIMGERAHFDGESFSIPKGEFDQSKKEILAEYYRLAKEIIPKRVAFFSHQTGLTPSAVKINSARGRWGSCSGKNSLNFSWRLIFAPRDVVDYVVVHELCHIKHHDHSKRFWNFVEEILPDYQGRRHQLKDVSAKLDLENWD